MIVGISSLLISIIGYSIASETSVSLFFENIYEKNLITNFQDSVHDNAIGYHRMLREKELVHSELDDIQGIGEVKKKALLKIVKK